MPNRHQGNTKLKKTIRLEKVLLDVKILWIIKKEMTKKKCQTLHDNNNGIIRLS